MNANANKVFECGDVVVATCGGPYMTVEGQSGSRVSLVWFDDEQHLQRGAAETRTLRLVPKTKFNVEIGIGG